MLARLGLSAQVVGVAVSSGVPEQPVGDDETRRGALNRARGALAAAGADLSVGIEAGVAFAAHGGAEAMGYCAAVSRWGRTSVVRMPALPLPPALAAALRQGAELGPLVDQLSGQVLSKQQGGLVGYLTRGAVHRQAVTELAVAYALVPFLHPELYPDEPAAPR